MTTQRIGPYLIIERIGAGGMGEIYLAQRASDGAHVALKLLAPHLANDRHLVERFIREGDALRQLRHPHIVETYGAGQADGRHFMAMAYVSGGNLADLMRQVKASGDRIPVEDALKITRQMSLALDYAHSKGFVHRDVKPANILRGDDGRWLLSDFGLVLMSDRTRITHTGGFMGTPAYSSPEQAKGLTLDGRSDIYSLGAVLFEMLAGNVPFAAPDTPAMLHAIVHAPPPRLSRVRPDVPSRVRQVVDMALAKKPAQRFQTAGQLLSAIDSALVGSARPAITQPKFAITAGIVLIALLVAGVAAMASLSSFAQRSASAPVADAQSTLIGPAPTPVPVSDTTTVPSNRAQQATATLRVIAEATVAPTPPAPAAEANAPGAIAGDCTIAWFFQRSAVAGACPIEAAQTQSVGEQRFERGQMFWFKESNEIAVLIDSSVGSWSYRVYPDMWREGMIVRDTALQPPSGRQQPERGFGLVWRNEGLVKQIGWATQAGTGYDSQRQRFFRPADGATGMQQGFVFAGANGEMVYCAGDGAVGQCVQFVKDSELVFPSVTAPEPTPCASTSPYPLDAAMLKEMGCPADKFVPSRNVVTQHFDNGFMIIFDDPQNSNFSQSENLYKFYILHNDGRAWRVYFPKGTPNKNASPNPDDWYSCEARPGLRPKDSRIPWRGFGMVWCRYPNIRSAIGFVRPGADEVPGTAAFQSYNSGRVFELNGRRHTIFLNFDDNKPDTYLEGRWQ